jgi:hypothetical protein
LRLKYVQDFYFTEGDFIIQGLETNNSPKQFVSVSQNFPNPFTNESFVNLSIGQGSDVVMDIYSITGQIVSSKDFGYLPEGNHSLRINGENLCSGVYFFTLKIGKKKITKKMIIE